MILVGQDLEGIRLAALQLFDESLREKEMDRVISNAAQTEDLSVLERVLPAQKLSPGYRDWVTYLIWLKGKIDTGITFALSADEAEGLTALVGARQEFEREHPCCGRCGARQYSKVSMRCRSCSVDLRK